VCAAVALPYSLYVVAIGGDYMAMARFFVPVLPFAMIAAAASIERTRRAASSRARVMIAALVAASFAGLLLQSTPLEARLFEKPWFGLGNWRGVQSERWQVARLMTIGEFFRDYGRGGESLATRSIGAIGFVSELEIFDLHGLTDPHIARQPGRDLGTGFSGHEKSDLAYTLSKRPTFVMLSRHLVARPTSMDTLPASLRSQVEGQYRTRARLLHDQRNGERGYFGFLERIDRDEEP
jgi:hypothetical protein